jgi:hypothetical protein
MNIITKDGLRFNAYSRIELTTNHQDEEGKPVTVVSVNLYDHKDIWALNGIEEVEEASPPDDEPADNFYRTETGEAPYVIYTRKPQVVIDQSHNATVRSKIAFLESGQARCVREAALTGDKTRLQALDTEISDLRATLIKDAEGNVL